jgi:formylglycine-generating enzyme required for sulfatase activity
MGQTTAKSLPAILLDPLARGNCIVCFGLGTSPDTLKNQRQEYIQKLISSVRQASITTTPLHKALAGFPIRRYVDFSYDNRLAQALVQAQRPYTPIWQDHDLPYADPGRVLLLKPYGRYDQPEALIVSRDDHEHLLSDFQPSRPLILEQLRLWMATQVLLWVDCNPDDAWLRRLRECLCAGIHPNHRREYALVSSGPEFEAWQAQGVTPLQADDPVAWLTGLRAAVRAMPAPAQDILPGPALPLTRRPYKFLDYYEEKDADLFFGRQAWIEQLSTAIRAHPLVILTGPSGVGKTSLLRAGVFPDLQQHDCWTVYARPGQDALQSVRQAVLEALSPSDQAALAPIADLPELLAAAGQRLDRLPVIVLDQAEECFTALAAPVRQRWVEAFGRAVTRQAGQVHWVLALREDFLGELDAWSGWVAHLFEFTQRLAPLDRPAAAQAITSPAERVGLQVEPALVERMLDELTLDAVAPAQLQIVCERLYQARDAAGRMTLAAYEALGGARRILAEYVDFALAQFPQTQRELAVGLLKAMVTGRETKLPLSPAEIFSQSAGILADQQAALKQLVDVRLVRSLEVGHQPRYELAHEALVEKIKTWIDAIEQQAHIARDLLRQGQQAWAGLHVLPETEKIAYLHTQRDNPYLRLEAGDLELMLRAALASGLHPSEWTRRYAAAGLNPWPLLEAAWTGEDAQRIQVLRACAGWADERALTTLQNGMQAESPRVCLAAHQALYTLGNSQALALLDRSAAFRLVPAGPFQMGSEQGNDEKPIHTVDLPAFFIARYPVTNAQYARFLEAGGYADQQWWTRPAWEWTRRLKSRQPGDWEKYKTRLDHPVVYVSWYEAAAYAAWAGMRLLTEAEWEKAASWEAGAGQQPARKRAYPWGDEFDKNKCNNSEAGLKTTTPVGQYSPQGDSPYGVADMAGNVWEWCSSLYRSYPYQKEDGREDVLAPGNRVQRGGSWNIGHSNSRCAYRSYNYGPVARLDNYGFRVGWLPGTDS